MSRGELAPGAPAWPGFEAMLLAAGLPTDDLADPGQRFFAFDEGYGGYALQDGAVLLRSVVVAPGRRGQGHGGRLLEQLLDAARAEGAAEAWLLTTGAAGFFARHGFTARERGEAPAAVAASRQFSAICPASAVLMCRKPL